MKSLEAMCDLKVGDRIRLVRGLLGGQTGRVSHISEDGSYWLIGDWTQKTGFVRVPYGPIGREWLEKWDS